MSIFSQIKEQTDISKVIEAYGVTLKHNKACCPFHNEKTPSFSVNNKLQYFHCFGCGVGGDVTAFVSRLFNLTAIDAAKKINTDFGLNLSISNPDARQIQKLKHERAMLDAYKNWCITKYNELCDEYQKNLSLQRKEHTICKMTNQPFSDEFCAVTNNLFNIELSLSILNSDNEKLKIKWFREEIRKGVINNDGYRENEIAR